MSGGDDQTNIRQAHALRAAGCRRIFKEAAAGTGSGCTACSTNSVRVLDRLSRALTVVTSLSALPASPTARPNWPLIATRDTDDCGPHSDSCQPWNVGTPSQRAEGKKA